MSRSEPHILLLMSGSIACAKAASLVSAWVKQGIHVRIATTRSVAQFIGNATLEGLSGHPVLKDAFNPGQVMDHINLARWADLVIAAPATSNLLNKFAAGIADGGVTTLWQAAYGRGKPLAVVPAMNSHMWDYPATQDSLRKLESWGVHVLPTAEGELACGEFGAGRLLEPDEILRYVDALLARTSSATGRRVMVTAGGTREAIDSVRYIGNLSTGRTAAALADALTTRGHLVAWLGAESAVRPRLPCRLETFLSYADLAAQLEHLLGAEPYDAVIHAAAVSDFSVERVTSSAGEQASGSGKLPSGKELLIQLRPNAKLLDRLRAWSANPHIRVIGFKLTDGANAAQTRRAIARQFDEAGVEAVVHNDLTQIKDGRHPFSLHTSTLKRVNCAGHAELAERIGELLEKAS